jgi:hypothetical protein
VGKELEESIVNDILSQVFIRKKQHLLCGWKEAWHLNSSDMDY